MREATIREHHRDEQPPASARVAYTDSSGSNAHVVEIPRGDGVVRILPWDFYDRTPTTATQTVLWPHDALQQASLTA